MKKNPEKTDQNHPVTPLRRADVESKEKKKSIETKITIIRKRTNEQTNKHNTHKHTNSQTYIQRRSTYIQIHTNVQNYKQNTHLGIRGLRYRLDGSGIVITRYLFAHIAPNEN
jgi:hypothetical protein